LKVFGCACWPHLRPYNNHKLDFRSKLCIFLGYSLHHKGYRCLHVPSGRIFISRNVVFDETLFPFKTSIPASSNSPTSLPLSLPSSIQVPSPFPPESSSSSPLSVSSSSNGLPAAPVASTVPVLPADPVVPPVAPPAPSHPMRTRSKNAIHKPKSLPPDFLAKPPPKAFVSTTGPLEVEPTCFTLASKSPHWRAAMNAEFTALMHNGTWSLVPPKPNMNLVGCKWVFRIKHKPDGSIERYKARLVAKGFHQQHGVDYGDTFSPVIKPTTIRIVLSLAVSSQWPIKQLDVQNAFLHGTLEENVFMVQPPGFLHPSKPDHVCHLHKALYGLKQAPRAWFSKLTTRLLELGFVGSRSDSSLYIFSNGPNVIYFLIYVDDIIVTGPNAAAIDHLIISLQRDFALKDLGPLHYFLGVEALHDTHGLFLSQRKYILDLLKRANMLGAKPISSPMSSSTSLSAFSGAPFSDPSLYRSIVGSLQYLSLTRPDVSYAVNKVCQFMHRPTVLHWAAVKRLLRYLKQTLSHGLLIRRQSSLHLHAFSDSDWAGCPRFNQISKF
jgi:hypothetical protein